MEIITIENKKLKCENERLTEIENQKKGLDEIIYDIKRGVEEEKRRSCEF